MKAFLALAALAYLLTNVAAVPTGAVTHVPLVKADFDLERRDEQRQQQHGNQPRGGQQGDNGDNDGGNDDPGVTSIESKLNDVTTGWADCFTDPQKCHKKKSREQNDKGESKNSNPRRAATASQSLSSRRAKPRKRASNPFFVYE